MKRNVNINNMDVDDKNEEVIAKTFSKTSLNFLKNFDTKKWRDAFIIMYYPVLSCCKAISLCIFFAVSALNLTYDAKTDANDAFDKVFGTSSGLIFGIGSLVFVIIPTILGSFLIVALFYCKHVIAWNKLVTFAFFFGLAVGFGSFLERFCLKFNLLMDNFTFYFLVWIFAVLGVISIRWKTSLILFKGYLIIFATLASILQVYWFPPTFIWVSIVAEAVNDIFSVLHSYGPINMLTKISEETKTPFPEGLEYPLSNGNNHKKCDDLEESEQSCNMIGLGDLVHFSLLVGLASTYGDWISTFACYLGIILGIGITFIFAFAQSYRSFPGLPIPVFMGIFGFVYTKMFVTPLFY